MPASRTRPAGARRGGADPRALPPRVLASFVAALVAAGAMLLVVERSARDRQATALWVRENLTVLAEIQAARGQALELGRGLRGYLVTGQAGLLDEQTATRQALRAHLGELRRLTADNAEQQASLATLQTTIDNLLVFQDRLLATARGGELEAARALFERGEGERLYDAMRAHFRELDDRERAQLLERQAREIQADRRVTATLVLLALLLAGILVGALLLVRHQFAARARAEAELRALNADLEARGSELRAANAELEAFGYTVSHDLRAPLRHIAGFVELLQKSLAERATGDERRKLEVVAGAARKMGTLIDDLLAFSRLGRREMERATVDLDALVDEVIASLDGELAKRELEWRRTPLPEVEGDAAMLRQLVANLVSNAVKFSRGRQPAVVEITPLAETDGEVVVAVRDNGAGFDMAYAEKLFGVFQRLHRAEEFEGTGVGMAIARRVVERHGGRIWAEGRPGEGAAFYFALPGARNEATAKAVEEG